jgi:hypothetical protein
MESLKLNYTKYIPIYTLTLIYSFFAIIILLLVKIEFLSKVIYFFSLTIFIILLILINYKDYILTPGTFLFLNNNELKLKTFFGSISYSWSEIEFISPDNFESDIFFIHINQPNKKFKHYPLVKTNIFRIPGYFANHNPESLYILLKSYQDKYFLDKNFKNGA